MALACFARETKLFDVTTLVIECGCFAREKKLVEKVKMTLAELNGWLAAQNKPPAFQLGIFMTEIFLPTLPSNALSSPLSMNDAKQRHSSQLGINCAWTAK